MMPSRHNPFLALSHRARHNHGAQPQWTHAPSIRIGAPLIELSGMSRGLLQKPHNPVCCGGRLSKSHSEVHSDMRPRASRPARLLLPERSARRTRASRTQSTRLHVLGRPCGQTFGFLIRESVRRDGQSGLFAICRNGLVLGAVGPNHLSLSLNLMSRGRGQPPAFEQGERAI